jgi:hypothetical protein
MDTHWFKKKNIKKSIEILLLISSGIGVSIMYAVVLTIVATEMGSMILPLVIRYFIVFCICCASIIIPLVFGYSMGKYYKMDIDYFEVFISKKGHK